MEFRTILRILREEYGYTSQASFAKDFGVAQTTVAGWEGGKREPPFATLIRLANFFSVSTDYLLGLTPIRQDLSSPAASVSPGEGISAKEWDIILSYRVASAEDRAIIDNIVCRYAQKSEGKTLA